MLVRRPRIWRSLSKFRVIIWCVVFLFMYAFILALNVVEQPKSQHVVLFDQSKFPVTSREKTAKPEVVNKTTKKDDAGLKIANTNGCQQWYEGTLSENLRVISEYPRGNVGNILNKIKGQRASPETMLTSFPVIGTAANSGFYEVAQGLLKSIHEILLPKYNGLKIVFYDLGLSNAQREELKLNCKCEVRIFPFEEFPDHVRRLKTYAWKPIIVQTLLMEFGWVWWMDSSVRFVTSELDSALKYSVDNHILFFTYANSFAVAFHTDGQTMQFLKEDPCKFRHLGEIEATFVLFHHDDVTSVLVEAWCACALSSDCIAPPGTPGKLSCNVRKRVDGRCHRFDQAVLSILLRRLYHDQNDYPLVETPFKIHQIKRGNRVNYFQSLKTS